MINRLTTFVYIFSLFFSLNTIVCSQNKLSLEQAVKRVKQQNNGRIISAATRLDKKQRNIHNIRVLTPRGQLKRYQINERTGQNMRSQQR